MHCHSPGASMVCENSLPRATRYYPATNKGGNITKYVQTKVLKLLVAFYQ